MSEFAGYEALADREVAHECAGALTVQQREMMKFQEIAEANPGSKKTLQLYKKQHPKGLTRDGILALIQRSIFGGTALGGVKMSTPDLNDAEIGYDVLGAWIARRAKP